MTDEEIVTCSVHGEQLSMTDARARRWYLAADGYQATMCEDAAAAAEAHHLLGEMGMTADQMIDEAIGMVDDADRNVDALVVKARELLITTGNDVRAWMALSHDLALTFDTSGKHTVMAGYLAAAAIRFAKQQLEQERS